jgi:hypothetical protein
MLTPQPTIGGPLKLPPTQTYSSVPGGGVFSFQSTYWEKLDDHTAWDLINVSSNPGFTGTEQVLYFPNASLSLG